MNMATTAVSDLKLTGFRLNPVTLARLKTRAKTEKVSLNTLVDTILTNEVKDIRSEEEILESKRRTDEFLSLCVGVWSGEEFDGVEDYIESGKTSKESIEL